MTISSVSERVATQLVTAFASVCALTACVYADLSGVWAPTADVGRAQQREAVHNEPSSDNRPTSGESAGLEDGGEIGYALAGLVAIERAPMKYDDVEGFGRVILRDVESGETVRELVGPRPRDGFASSAVMIEHAQDPVVAVAAMWAFGGGRVYLYDLADALSQAPTVTPRLQIAGNIGEIFGAGLYTPTAADLADLVRRAESAELDSESLGRRPLLGVYSVFAAGYGDSYIRRSLHDAVTGEVVLIESDASALDRGAALLGADLNGDGVVDAGDLAAFWRYGDSRAPPRRRAAARCGRI